MAADFSPRLKAGSRRAVALVGERGSNGEHFCAQRSRSAAPGKSGCGDRRGELPEHLRVLNAQLGSVGKPRRFVQKSFFPGA